MSLEYDGDRASRVHIYAPAPLETRIVWSRCYGCRERKPVFLRSPLLVSFYEWYDPTCICLRCGEILGVKRPWSPGWRAANRRSALRKADTLGLCVPATVRISS